MKKLIFIFLLIPSLVFAEGTNFRNTKWGMTKKQVIATENQATTSYELSNMQILMCSDEIAGLTTSINYWFTKNALTMAVYIITTEHANINNYIQDYEKLKSLLKKKYGRAKKDTVEWKNRSHKKDSAKYGLAITQGNLAYHSEWKAQNTKVHLDLMGFNGEISLGIRYTGINIDAATMDKL